MNDAIARHRKTLEANPDNELTRFSLGKALFDEGDFAGAREQLSLALASRPDWMVVQILLARCELNLGNKEAARPALERALDLARKQGHVGPLAQVEELLRQLNPA
jgi:Flp pilus assembly protein TadD